MPLSPRLPDNRTTPDWDKPARDRPLQFLLAHFPRRTLWKVLSLLLLLAAVIYFRNRADSVVRFFGPVGLEPTPTGRENRHVVPGGGFSNHSVPSSPR